MKSSCPFAVAATVVVLFSCAQSVAQVLVSGRVVDDTGNPLGDVMVELVVRGLSQTTGADGTFELLEDATVVPLSRGPAAGWVARLQGDMISVVAGTRAARVNVRLLDPRGRLAAVVYDRVLKSGASLRAPVFGRAAGLAHGVYVLQVDIDGTVGRYKILHAGASGQASVSKGSSGPLAKTLAAVDTLQLSKSGYTTKNVAVEKYGVDLGDIVLEQGGGNRPRVVVGALQAFGHSTINVTALSGWPAGRTPKAILTQGARASGYVRRAWKPTLNNGAYVDFVAGWRPTTSQETIRLQLDDNSEVDLAYTVVQTIPSPTGGGVTRTLDPTGSGDFTTWAAAIAALGSGDVLVVRAATGTWTDGGGHEIPNFVYDVSTKPAPPAGVNNVTVVAHPGDLAAGRRPVIWRNAGRYARFKYDAAGSWQVHADLGGGNVVYQSVDVLPAPTHCLYSAYRDQIGDWLVMYNYQAMNDATDRSSIMHDISYPRYSGLNSTTYMGPSLLHNRVTNRLEVRLNPPPKQTCMNPSASPWPPSDWTKHYPPSTNPANCEIVATDGDGVGSWNALLDLTSRNGWKFYNIDFVYGNSAIIAHNQTVPPQFFGCNFLGGASPDFTNNGLNISYTPSAVLNYNVSSSSGDLLFDRCVLHGGCAPWMSWAEGKGFEGAFGLMARREMFSWSTPVLCRYSKITRWWHFSWMGTSDPVKFHFHHCYLRDFGADGGLTSHHGNEDLLVNRCFLPSAVMYGFSTSGGSGVVRNFSFNVDLCLSMFESTSPNKNKYANLSEGVDIPYYCHPQSIGHGGAAYNTDRKYHNTHVGSQNTIGVEFFDGHEGCGSGIGPDSRGDNHRVFDCIGAVYPPPVAWPLPGVSSLVGLYSTKNGNNQYDYNVLFKSPDMLDPGFGSNTFFEVNGGSGWGTAYADIAALRSGTGFETHGTQADPQFVVKPAWASTDPFAPHGAFDMSNYMLGANSPARTGGRNLDDQKFPDYDFDALTTWAGGDHASYRGALDPNVPFVEQEVGIVGPEPPEIP